MGNETTCKFNLKIRKQMLCEYFYYSDWTTLGEWNLLLSGLSANSSKTHIQYF